MLRAEEVLESLGERDVIHAERLDGNGLAGGSLRLAQHVRQLREGRAGRLRVGMGSGPGAMLMNPLLLEMAQRHPAVRLTISRGAVMMFPR